MGFAYLSLNNLKKAIYQLFRIRHDLVTMVNIGLHKEPTDTFLWNLFNLFVFYKLSLTVHHLTYLQGNTFKIWKIAFNKILNLYWTRRRFGSLKVISAE